MTDGKFWYTVTVQISVTDEVTGKTKRANEPYLVQAISVTDAEAKVVKFFEGMTVDYRIKKVDESKIIEIIQ